MKGLYPTEVYLARCQAKNMSEINNVMSSQDFEKDSYFGRGNAVMESVIAG